MHTSLLMHMGCVRSVLIHLLPGLAIFARKYASVPPQVTQLAPSWLPLGLSSPALQQQPAWQPSGLAGNLGWLFVAPLGFYLAWQALYFLIVQVCCSFRVLTPVFSGLWSAAHGSTVAMRGCWQCRCQRSQGDPRCHVYKELTDLRSCQCLHADSLPPVSDLQGGVQQSCTSQHTAGPRPHCDIRSWHNGMQQHSWDSASPQRTLSWLKPRQVASMP